MTPFTKLSLKGALVALNTLVLIGLTFLLQYTSVVRFDEIGFFKLFANVKYKVLRIDPKPVGDSIAFLDISKDLQLVDDTAAGYGSIVITDRKLLTKLFSLLNRHSGEYRGILCDLSFDYPSGDDTALKEAIESSARLVTAVSLNKGQVMAPLFRVPYGGVDYLVNQGTFVKLPIFYDDSIESLPLVAAQRWAGKYFSRRNHLTFEDGRLAFNTIIPEWYYRSGDIIDSGHYQNRFYLGELLASDSAFHYLRNKYIVVGDFSTDNHATAAGVLPGPLILFDTYLTLARKSVVISWIWATLLVLFYGWVSYSIFFLPENVFTRIHQLVKWGFLRNFMKVYISYIGILILVNLISYLVYGVFISLFYLATYLTVITLIVEKRRHYIRSGNFKSFIKEEMA